MSPKASALAWVRDPTASNSASGTSLVASASLPAMLPVLMIPHRAFVLI